MAIYEDFNGACPRYYVKFVGTLPSRDALMEQFIAALTGLPDQAKVVETGMGSGSLAEFVLQTSPSIARYIGIEPSQAMVEAIPPALLLDSRFRVEQQVFESWNVAASSVDVVLCRYVVHDFPELLETWYESIARCLKPGGLFVSLDVTVADNPAETQANLTETIRLAQQIKCTGKQERVAQERFVRHLQEEIDRYRPLEEHLAILRGVGLVPTLQGRAGNNYLLRAEKPV